MADVFLFDAVRTPRGKGREGGGLSSLRPPELVRQLIEALRRRNGRETIDQVERLLLSCVGQIGAQGGHIAMVSKLYAKLPVQMTAHSINNFCAGGLSAIGMAAAAIRSGDIGLAIAGGVEMMSRVPFLGDQADYYHDPETAAALGYLPVGLSADWLAQQHGVSRETLDSVSLQSHTKAAAAWDNGRYVDSVIPVLDAKGAVLLATDETIRRDLTADRIAQMPPVFEAIGRAQYDAVIAAAKPGTGPVDHRHSVANCPPVADGAALVLLGSRAAGASLGLTPIARLVALVEAAADPVAQLTAGAEAMQRLMARQGLEITDFDLIEYMEAFAVVPSLFFRQPGVDPARVNVNGGHLAMGHPMGATGAILVATLVREMQRQQGARGLVVAHGGSGVGVAALLEQP